MKPLILLFYSLLLLSCGKEDRPEVPAEVEQLRATRQYKEINGVDPNLLSLDIFIPVMCR